MKLLSRYTALMLAGLICLGVTGASAQKQVQKEKYLLAAEDIQWKPLADAPPGVMSVVLWGDNMKGAYGGLTKFPAGFKMPLHYHTYETKIVVIKGAYTHNGKKYGPGSYLSIPGGDKHETAGAGDSESIFLIQQPDKFDIVVLGAEAQKK